MSINNIVVKTIAVSDITVGERIRKEQGDIKELAENIAALGLLNPITVMGSGNGGFYLIAGYRRLCAVKYLNRPSITATILPEMNSEDNFLTEISENEIRKNYTMAERLEYALQLKKIETEKAKQRQATHSCNGYVKNPEESTGRVRDIVAKIAGFSSGKTLERAIYIAENRPDLFEKVDREEMTVFGAYQLAKKKKVSAEEHTDLKSELPKLPPLFVPEEIKVSGDGIKGAKHEELMQNPLYRSLYDSYMELVKTVSQMTCQSKETKQSYEAEVRSLKQQLKDAKSKSAQRGEAE